MKTPIDPTVAEMVDLLDPNQREMFEERAALRSEAGGFSIELAEALGLLDVLDRYPEALTRVVAFEIEIEGVSRTFVAGPHLLTELAEAKGGAIKMQMSVAFAVEESFGIAELIVAA